MLKTRGNNMPSLAMMAASQLWIQTAKSSLRAEFFETDIREGSSNDCSTQFCNRQPHNTALSSLSSQCTSVNILHRHHHHHQFNRTDWQNAIIQYNKFWASRLSLKNILFIEFLLSIPKKNAKVVGDYRRDQFYQVRVCRHLRDGIHLMTTKICVPNNNNNFLIPLLYNFFSCAKPILIIFGRMLPTADTETDEQLTRYSKTKKV